MIYLNVTNTFTHGLFTGIQRVVRELSCRLHHHPEYAIVVFQEGEFYQLTKEEEFDSFSQGIPCFVQQRLSWQEWSSGDIFFDIDATWADPLRYDTLYRALKRKNILIYRIHHDATPFLFPEFFKEGSIESYRKDFLLSYPLVDHWFCISQIVERDLHRIAANLRLSEPQTSILVLGADYLSDHVSTVPLDLSREEPETRAYCLMVGTIEPRKNYSLLLKVIDALESQNLFSSLDFIIVGRRGWNCDEWISHIQSYPYNKRLRWISGASDEELERLYAGAKACLCLSFYEGMGLPAIEALGRGVPVICTRGSAMEEYTKGFSIPVDLTPEAVIQGIQQVMAQQDWSHLKQFAVPTWDHTVQQIVSFCEVSQDLSALSIPPSQAVYLSIHPERCLLSMTSVAQHLSFIQEFLIVTTDKIFEEMRKTLQAFSHPVVILKFSELGLGALSEDLPLPSLLRVRDLYGHPALQENFISFHDECLAIRWVPLEFFMENGQHKGYFFHQDPYWLGSLPTPIPQDHSFWHTMDFLKAQGLGTTLFSPHHPQIINKTLVKKISENLENEPFNSPYPLEEYSLYFNKASHLKPLGFQNLLSRMAGEMTGGSEVKYLEGGREIKSGEQKQKKPPFLFLKGVFSSHSSPEALQVIADQWGKEEEEKESLISQIQPSLPALRVDSHRVFFDHETLSIPTGLSFTVPILCKQQILRLEYDFLNESCYFEFPQIPNGLFIPFDSVPFGEEGCILHVRVYIREKQEKPLETHLTLHRIK